VGCVGPVLDPASSELQTVLASLALTLFRERSLKADLERLVRLTCRVIPSCASGSVALLVEGEPSTTAVSDRVAMELDLIQYDAGEGPCLSALGGQTIRFGVLQGDQRFPHFAIGAADQRIRSVLSTPVRHDEHIVGTLNLYSRLPDGFDREAERVADIACAEVATAVVKAEVYRKAHEAHGQLQQMHDDEVQIAQAEGALVAIHACSSTQARALLEHASHSNGDTLVQVARRILAAADQP